MNDTNNVLIIDDDLTILEAYVSILTPYKKTGLEDAILKLEKLHDIEISEIEVIEKPVNFNLFQANNGLDGVEIFRKNYEKGSVIPVCIVDMRMPNGIDGIETSLRLKQIDPDVHIIIATAYSDRTNKEILDSLRNNTYYIRKPFNSEEIYQLVHSLSASYHSMRTIQRLNNDLELRIKDELEKNRQKDALIFHQAKLAAMGEMIGNIAHQWRQPLNIVSMLFQKINRQYKNGTLDDNRMNNCMTQAMSTINHMSQTIDDFRNHIEPNRDKSHHNLSFIIENTVSLLEESFKLVGISTKISVEENIEFYGVSEDVKQVLLNLLNNAKDAITSNSVSNGRILVEALNVNNNKDVQINIYDNGGGVDELYIDKIFEPYFTTKHKSQGTGIGLYMSRRILEERLAGRITVSNTNEGACFAITIKK